MAARKKPIVGAEDEAERKADAAERILDLVDQIVSMRMMAVGIVFMVLLGLLLAYVLHRSSFTT